MEELKKELSSLREFVVLQSKEIVKLKRGSRLENENEDDNRWHLLSFIKNSGQGQNPKLRVSSYFHMMMGYFRLGKVSLGLIIALKG